jgi:hypothetical protein
LHRERRDSVATVVLMEVCEVLAVSQKARANIAAVPAWSA